LETVSRYQALTVSIAAFAAYERLIGRSLSASVNFIEWNAWHPLVQKDGGKRRV
jgi:hypothetical protein